MPGGGFVLRAAAPAASSPWVVLWSPASLGLAYLQRFGAHVRTAVFDSGSLLDIRLWQLTAIHPQQAFDQMARRCAADPACNRSYDPAADLATVVASLRAHPARVTVTGPGGQPQTVTIDLAATPACGVSLTPAPGPGGPR